MSDPKRILLVDDHALVRQGLRLILESESAFTVEAEAADGAEAVKLLEGLRIDLVILDITMPRMTGIQALTTIRQRWPEVPVIMLSMHDNERFVLEALRAGASGYVLKSSVDRDLLTACHAALSGGAFLHAGATRALVDRVLLEGTDADEPMLLSVRETEILKLVAEGHSNRAIAELLVISVKTVEGHRARIAAKLGISDRVALARYAIRAGLTEP